MENQSTTGADPEFDRAFWANYPGLVWSNPNAGDTIRIRAALLRPYFRVLLDIAVHFGLERLCFEWHELKEGGEAAASRAAPIVERILSNIEKGFALAAETN
jgi:hypothetical protein